MVLLLNKLKLCIEFLLPPVFVAYSNSCLYKVVKGKHKIDVEFQVIVH